MNEGKEKVCKIGTWPTIKIGLKQLWLIGDEPTKTHVDLFCSTTYKWWHNCKNAQHRWQKTWMRSWRCSQSTKSGLPDIDPDSWSYEKLVCKMMLWYLIFLMIFVQLFLTPPYFQSTFLHCSWWNHIRINPGLMNPDWNWKNPLNHHELTIFPGWYPIFHRQITTCFPIPGHGESAQRGTVAAAHKR